MTPFIVLIFPFWNAMSVLCLPHHCILEADHLSGFTGSQMKRNFAPPTTDLGELNDDIRDFELTFR